MSNSGSRDGVKRQKPPVRASAPIVWAAILAMSLGCRRAAIETDEGWRDLFDGKSLSGWKMTEFGGGEDEVRVEDGRIILDFGAADLSGVNYTGATPTMDYEVSLEAMRVDGVDFFCGLTFPYKDSCCTLIAGGWGGDLIGISSFDRLDASENETTTYMNFENGRWHKFLLRVTEDRIEAWINDLQVIDAHPGAREVSVRPEVDLSQPFGLAAWNTKAALRNIRLRSLAESGKHGGRILISR
jgi:hypothetical protein